MQKPIKTIFFILLFFAANSLYSQSFEVVKIDSTKRHYIISIKGNDGFFGKIITNRSRKNRKYKSNPKIVEGKSYQLEIDVYYFFKFLNKNSYKTETGGKGKFKIEGFEIWNVNDNFTIYETKDIKGLYYTKENESRIIKQNKP